MTDNCLYCGAKIQVMCRKGTDVCSGNCEAALAAKEAAEQTTIEENNENA